MKSVAVRDLTPGMILGENIVFQDEIICSAGTKLDNTIIDRLVENSVTSANVMEDVDFVSTHYEKIRFNQEFKRFERDYNTALMRYKQLMYTFLQTGTKVPDEELLQLYRDVRADISSGAMLLDYLYNLMPNEDELTFSHCMNSALLAGAIADWLSMDDDSKNCLILCGFYYDIGKLRLPYELLWKPGKLTAEEFKVIQTHPVVGYMMIRDLTLDTHVKNAVVMHHERLDGSGYPYHMRGQKIDIYARYIAIIDAYIAMASPRSYRVALTPLQILGNLQSDMSKFDVELLMPIMKKIADVQIGTRVQTSDGRIWEVLIIHSNQYSRPIMKNEHNEFLNLLEHPELEIKKMM